MTGQPGQNDFLVNLLALQQDGRQAISAPANWTKEDPLLEVPTETDEIVNELENTLLKGANGNTVARWHFFIGSPGNGKSAAIGKLCRGLLRGMNCCVLDEQGTSIEDLESTVVPYALRVFEGENQFASAMIVQDASVVRNPFAADVDPASELIATIKDAWEKGISLVVCTNRGVIEKAYRERYLDPEIKDKLWFKILRRLIENGEVILQGELGDNWIFDGRRPVFQKAKVTFSYLDNRSLLLGSSIFDELIQKAVADAFWTSCPDCDVLTLCPFKANRDWLADPGTRAIFLHLLRRGEILSGQIIVFREALAFISLLLSGCPRDYLNVHPCQWVRFRVESSDIFSLASRRLYMSVFSSFSRYGLESDALHWRRQLEGLSLLRTLAENGSESAACLDNVLFGQPPSTDVGVDRLFGTKGIFPEIDPWRECLPADFLDEWDGDLSTISQCPHPLFTEIERRSARVWATLEELIESTASHEASLCHWALKRWSSNFLIHFGSLLEGRTSWAKELDDFISILETLVKDPAQRSADEKRHLRELDRQLEKLLAARVHDQAEEDTVSLSDSVTLSGRWVADKLRPTIDASKRMSSLSIMVKFQAGEVGALSARAFLWLSRHLQGKLDARCFPEELLTGVIDARIRAAAKGQTAYAFANDDVSIIIRTDGQESFVLSRYDGDADVE